jgi:hypothetical protein
MLLGFSSSAWIRLISGLITIKLLNNIASLALIWKRSSAFNYQFSGEEEAEAHPKQSCRGEINEASFRWIFRQTKFGSMILASKSHSRVSLLESLYGLQYHSHDLIILDFFT